MKWRADGASLSDKGPEMAFFYLSAQPALRFNTAKGGPMRKIVTLSAVFFSVLAVAQGLPRFGTARFGEAIFGVAEPALPVPFMPLWATVTLAAALWAVAYLMPSKES